MATLPPELDMDNFDNVMASIDIGDLDVVDEVGGDDSEEENGRDKRSNTREKEKRSRTRSIGNSRERSQQRLRNRSRSPRRHRSKSKSRDRVRRRSPPKRSPPAKKGGAADFLKDIEKEFGVFEGLKEVRSKVETHTILNNRDKSYRHQNRTRQNSNNQYPNIQYQNNMNNVMPNQMVNNPMALGPNMMGPGPMPLVGYPIQMTAPGFGGGICPPGMGPSMGYNMQPQVPLITQLPVPVPQPPVVHSNSGEFRNASPPPSSTSSCNPDLGNISSRLLAQNRMNLSEYLETQLSSGRNSSKTIEAKPLRERVLSKCKAALHRLNHAANDIQFDLNFLHVPPVYPSDTADAIGASPILPSKQNPLFRISTKNRDAIQKCRPYPSVTRNIDSLIAQLGIDESVIASRLESITSDRTELLSHKPNDTHKNSTHFRTTSASSTVLQLRPESRDEACQTPKLACAKCDKRQSNLINTQTQTNVIESYSKSAQTQETDFQLAKIKWNRWEKEQKQRFQSFKREYAEAFSDEEVEDEKPPPRAAIGPPGFRYLKPTTSTSTTKSSRADIAAARRYYDRYS